MLSALAGKELREASLILDDAETRYLSFLRDFPNLEGRLKLHHIASHLGMSPVSLSRVRKKLGKNHPGLRSASCRPGPSPKGIDESG
jgi:hypothetical protein